MSTKLNSSKYSMYHEQFNFVYTQLNDQRVLFETI